MRVLVLMLFLLRTTIAFGADLTSTARTTPASLATSQAVSVVVGGRARIIDGGSLVTAAEAIAASQVASTGKQSLVVGATGNATGGSINLGIIPQQLLNGLILPAGVTALNDFAKNRAIDIAGLLMNSGNIYAYSSSIGTTVATINAESIVNTTHGIISSITPSQFLPSISVAQLDLRLNSAGDILNAGVISSSGGLALSTGSGVIRNSGTLIAQSSNIDIINSSQNDLRLDSTGGTISAFAGNINVLSANQSRSSFVRMIGGSYFSNNLNIDAGKGSVIAALGEVSGLANITAGAASFGANTNNLQIGSLNIDGDPTYFASAGNLILSNLPNTGGAPLALVASGNVVVTSGVIDTTNANGGNGGALTIIAGANFASIPVPPADNDNAGTTISLAQSISTTHGSATGGAIDLSGVTRINTNGTLALDATGFSGGDVTLVAYSGAGVPGSTLTPGTINLGTTGSITTVGAGGTNGSILVIAGATSDPSGGSAITLPAMFTGRSPTGSQSGSTGGSITISTATPNLSGALNIQDGAILNGSGTFSAGTLQPTSITIGSQGGDPTGGTFPQAPSLTQWQLDAINYALAEINAFRAAEGVAPLTLSNVLTNIATQDAQYLVQSHHFEHVNISGATPVDRATAVGVNVNATGFGENIAVRGGTGVTAKDAFDVTNTDMENEPANQPNHRMNLLTHNFVGIGFAQVRDEFGDTYYIVENFSDGDPGALTPPNPVVPMVAGVQGGLGAVALSPSNKTLSVIGGNGVLETSMNTNGANVTVTSGKHVTVQGLILANGKQGNLLFQDPGANGGNVTINAAENVTLNGIQAAGGLGASNTLSATSAASGGHGGTVNITSQTGNVSILPGGACSPCLAVTVSGGAGGGPTTANASGGAGGIGGSVNITAPLGSITLTAIDAGGGGGSGGAGGTTGGSGGAGGAGGTISLSAAGTITVQDYLNASGGGGGGAGGKDANGNAGGGGGGGSLAMAGSGGSSGSAAAGGGGGGLAEIPGFGGQSLNRTAASGSTGASGSSGAGGAAGTFGGGGSGGSGTSGIVTNGGAGGGMGEAGSSNSTGTLLGGAGGSGGTISLNANAVVVTGNPADVWSRFTNASSNSNSILALGNGGTVNITSAGTASTTLNSNADYATSNKTISVDLSSSFGSVVAGSQPNSITVNGTQFNSPFNGGGGSGTPGTLIIIENGNPVVISTGDTVTPAEWAAIIQVRLTGSQSIVLDSLGTAIGGTLPVTTTNTPSGGFTTLNLPAGVTLLNSNPSLVYSVGMTIDGVFDGRGQTSKATINTPQLVLNGSLLADAPGLDILNTGPSFPLTIGPNAVISIGAGRIIADSLDITSTNPSISLNTNVNQININAAGGSVAISDIDSVTIGSVTAAKLSVTAGAPNGTINTIAPIGTDILELIASNIAINSTVTSLSIQLVSNGVSGDFTLSGTGTVGSPSSVTAIVATSGNLVFAPGSSLTFDGITNATANGANQSIVLSNGATLTNNGTLTLATSSFLQAGILSGNPQIEMHSLGKGTIANPNGDVVLPGGFTFVGADLAILASGNVRMSVPSGTINLSNTKGEGGNLTIIAGYELTGAAGDGTFKTPASTPYIIGNPSITGGSVYLPRMSVNVSSSATGSSAGDVLVLAHGGTQEAGMIAIGTINASARTGTAGSITLIGQGGVQTGALNASGATGGDIKLTGSEPQFLPNTFTVANGTLMKNSSPSAMPANTANGAAISVKGTINASGTKQSAGNVDLRSDAQIEVTGKITATGLTGGNVSIESGYGVKIPAGVTTSALAANSSTATGNAGAIDIQAGALINTGPLLAVGSKNNGTGDGGNGGSISLRTEQITVNGTPYAIGGIVVKGSIDSRGGMHAKSSSANNGEGGNITLDAGTVAVTGNINSSGNTAGAVVINTYAIQPLPVALDLTAPQRTIPVLPGALFTVGLTGSPNGVGGTITADGIINRTINGTGRIDATSTVNSNGVTITVTGDSGTLNAASIAAFNPITGKRTMVTPAEALALFQTSRGDTQTIALTQDGLSTGPATVTLPSIEVNSTNFSRFKLPENIALTIQGTRPVLTLPSSALISGDIAFDAGSTAFVNLGPAAMNLPSTASITTTGTLILSGTASKWTNNGLIDANKLILARPTAATLTLITSPTGTMNGNVVVAPSTNTGMTLIFKAPTGATVNAPVTFAQIPMPAIYSTSASANALNANTARTVSLSFDMPGKTATAAGALTAGSLKLTALNSTNLLLADGATFTINKPVSISTAAGSLNIGTGVTISSGKLSATAPDWSAFALVSKNQVTTIGGISIISGGGIDIGSNSTFVANGGNLTITTTAGNLTVLNDNTFRAMGGNIIALTAGTASGGTNNHFQAKGFVGTANGGIEIGSGLTRGILSSAFAKPAGTRTNTSSLTGVTVTAGQGVVIVNPSSQGTLTLGPLSALTLNKGAVVFDSIAPGSSINFGQTTFETKSAKPISFTETEEDIVLDADADE